MTEWIKRAKEWWWALSLILGATVFVATLPMRLSKVEAGVEEAQESVSDLELWAKELVEMRPSDPSYHSSDCPSSDTEQLGDG